MAGLASAVAAVPGFGVTFDTAAWFGTEVLWLAPEPADPFVALTAAVAAAFPAYPPYGGAHDEVIPHLTVGHDAPEARLRDAEADVLPRLPVSADISRRRAVVRRRLPGHLAGGEDVPARHPADADAGDGRPGPVI